MSGDVRRSAWRAVRVSGGGRGGGGDGPGARRVIVLWWSVRRGRSAGAAARPGGTGVTGAGRPWRRALVRTRPGDGRSVATSTGGRPPERARTGRDGTLGSGIQELARAHPAAVVPCVEPVRAGGSFRGDRSRTVATTQRSVVGKVLVSACFWEVRRLPSNTCSPSVPVLQEVRSQTSILAPWTTWPSPRGPPTWSGGGRCSTPKRPRCWVSSTLARSASRRSG